LEIPTALFYLLVVIWGEGGVGGVPWGVRVFGQDLPVIWWLEGNLEA
jgi:hypothetical protein